MNRRVKHVDLDVKIRHLDFFSQIPDGHKPTNIVEEPYGYSYDEVVGSIPNSSIHLSQVLSEAHKLIWSQTSAQNVPIQTKLAYIDYISRKLPDHLSYIMPKIAEIILDTILEETKNVHGDMTLENVIIDSDTCAVVFIDPGMVRRDLRCKELDVAKLLQSTYTRWEIMKQSAKKIPFWKRPNDIEMAFLITHWIRILSYEAKHGCTVQGKVEPTIVALWESL